jgi:large subunit ribosomal protein L1
MAKHGKKYLAALAKVDVEKQYSPREAVALARETSTTNFDATVEVHLRMGLDPRQADQQVRDVVVLPHGLGKTVRVLVFAAGEAATLARNAGADLVADDDETLNKIQGGMTDFDVAIATPDMMGKVGRLGRVLGPRGLMPNPKAGTVVNAEDLPRAIEEAKAGRVEFRLGGLRG